MLEALVTVDDVAIANGNKREATMIYHHTIAMPRTRRETCTGEKLEGCELHLRFIVI